MLRPFKEMGKWRGKSAWGDTLRRRSVFADRSGAGADPAIEAIARVGFKLKQKKHKLVAVPSRGTLRRVAKPLTGAFFRQRARRDAMPYASGRTFTTPTAT
jgi:hypothetical protein